MNDKNKIAQEVVDSALKIHRKLGPCLLESVYERVLSKELRQRGLKVETQKAISIEFEGEAYEEAFRADLWVEDGFIVELKSIEKLIPIHTKQLLTYLRLTHQPLGLLINFGEDTLKSGLKRVANFEHPWFKQNVPSTKEPNFPIPSLQH